MVKQSIIAVIIDDEQVISLADLCRGCTLPAEQVFDMIEYGIIEPLQPEVISSHWTFAAECVPRLQSVMRLQRDLDVNLAGVALVLELKDEVNLLRQQVRSLRRDE
ncbi:MAG: chaperone modulator CbpM [Gammaproteobacteria bacterium]|nr:chaperone modulator CbpM [Gammaproteobacteria bacterium]